MKILLFVLAGLFFALPMQSDEELVAKVKGELSKVCYEGCQPPFQDRLIQLADAKTIGEILADLIRKYENAQPPGLEHLYLTRSIFAAGKIRQEAAVPALVSIASSTHPKRSSNDEYYIKVLALQSIGEIDPLGNEPLLLRFLRNDYYPLRYEAARALALTDDPAVLQELDVQSSKERSHGAFLKMQALADAMRVRFNKGI